MVLSAPALVQDAAPAGPVVTVLQVVAVHWLPTVAGAVAHDDTPLPGTMRFGHVVVTQPLFDVAPLGEQLWIGVGPVVAVTQEVATQLLPESAAASVQVLTGVGPVVTVSHVVLFQLLPLLAGTVLQVWVPVGPVVKVAQLVAT